MDLKNLTEIAQKAKDLNGIKNYQKAIVAMKDFDNTFTPEVVLSLLKKIEEVNNKDSGVV